MWLTNLFSKRRIIRHPVINQKVHQDKNKFMNHMILVEKQAKVVDDKIVEAKKENKKLQNMLTTTAIIWQAAGNK